MLPTTVTTFNKIWFGFLILYLVADFVRPQMLIPALSVLHLGAVGLIALFYFVVTNKLYWFQIIHIRLIWYIMGLVVLLVPLASNNHYAFETAKVMVSYMPYILVVVACLVDIKSLKKIVHLQILVMICVAVTGIINGGRGTRGYFFDENDLSLYINTVLPFCYFFFIYQKEIFWKFVYATGLILGVTVNVISFSRGGFLGMAVIAMGIWYFGKKKLITIVIFGIIAVIGYSLVDKSYVEEMKTISNTSNSTASWRLMAWGSGVRMFLDNPMGVGGNNFKVHLPDYQPKDSLRLDWGRPAHSVWITLLSELGIVGVVLFVRLLYCIFKDLVKITKSPQIFEDSDYITYYSTALSLICGLMGFFASGTFLSVLYYPHLWYYIAIVAGMKRIEYLKNGE